MVLYIARTLAIRTPDWDTDVHHFCTLSLWFTADSMWVYSSTYYSFLPAPSVWWLMVETYICSFSGGNPTVWHGFLSRMVSNHRKEKHSWKQFELSSACITKERIMRTEDTPKFCLKLLSHAELRTNICQGKTEVAGPPGLILAVHQLADCCF